MKTKFLILVLFLIQVYSTAQNNYKPGFLITTKGDTIYGYINQTSNFNNSQLCEYKKDLNSEKIDYKPTEVEVYHIEYSKRYVSKEIKIKDSTETVFLELLLEGVVDLYFYDYPQQEYYFIEKEGVIYPLENNVIKVSSETRDYEGNSKRYLGMLKFLFQEVPELQKEIQSTDYFYKDLVDITEKYHNMICSDYACINYSKEVKKKFFLEQNVGASKPWLGFQFSSFESSDLALSYGVNLKMTSDKRNELWSFLIGLNFAKYSMASSWNTNLLSRSIYSDYNVQLQYSTLELPISLEYNFTEKKIQPFLGFGLTQVLVFNSSSLVEKIGLSYSYDFDPGIIRKYQIGLLAKAGMHYRINDIVYLNLNLVSEFRKPLPVTGYFLDYHNVLLLNLNFGLGFSL